MNADAEKKRLDELRRLRPEREDITFLLSIIDAQAQRLQAAEDVVGAARRYRKYPTGKRAGEILDGVLRAYDLDRGERE